MNEHAHCGDQIITSWQLKAGIGLFVLSIILPVYGIPLVAYLSLSTAVTALLTAVFLIGGEVLGIVAIALMGKVGYQIFKTHVARFFRQYGPPQTVSQLRYFIGLILFIAPILFGWLSIYVSHWIPYFSDNLILFGVTGDIVFLTSFFVLGGDFWDKIRSLFIHNAKLYFPENPKESSEGKAAEGIYG